MLPLSAERVLLLWEQGRHRHPIDRALLALAISCPERSPDELSLMPIGTRDAELFRLRRLTFGRELSGYTDCPQCHQRMEFSLDADTLFRATPDSSTPTTVTVKDTEFRLPTSRDLASIIGEADPQRAARLLLEHCRVASTDMPTELAASDWSDNLIVEAEQRLADADPGASIELSFSCELCGHCWTSLFDISRYLWEEIEAHAKRLLREVHLLARAYAWPEPDILAMSDARRALYLEMVGA